MLQCRAAAGRLQGLDDQLKGLKVSQEELGTQWNAEKDQMRSLQNIKEEIDRVNIEIQGAERDYDLNRAAELKYGTLLELQNKLTTTEKQLESQVCPFMLCCISFKDDLVGQPSFSPCKCNFEPVEKGFPFHCN